MPIIWSTCSPKVRTLELILRLEAPKINVLNLCVATGIGNDCSIIIDSLSLSFRSLFKFFIVKNLCVDTSSTNDVLYKFHYFSHFFAVKAFHIKWAELPTDPNVLKWNVFVINIDRHKRHLDRAKFQQFWEQLDKWVCRCDQCLAISHSTNNFVSGTWQRWSLIWGIERTACVQNVIRICSELDPMSIKSQQGWKPRRT